MFGYNYLKVSPTQYVLHFQNGRLRREGTGLAFSYYKPSSNISVVPVSSNDIPFIFNELSADFQTVTIQGQLTYRIEDPKRVAGLLDFSINGGPDRYTTEDPLKLPQRLINRLQTLVRGEMEHLPLRQALHSAQEIASTMRAALAGDEVPGALGVRVLDLSIQSIRPTPEMGRALEAEAREDLLRQADLAIYDRRNASVEQERRIKENELNTEIAVESKKRQIREANVEANLAVEAREQQVREAKLSGQIVLEEQRRRLVESRLENIRTEADAEAYAVEASLRPLAAAQPEVLQLISLQSAEPRRMLSLAFKELAQNAAKIGQLNITPELLENLLK
jgi:regulator of protease activity HflC (stomatin/prohibitin superfamily)